MHALQRIRTLLGDDRTGAAFADKCDGLDVLMLGQGPPCLLAITVDDIEDTGRQSSFLRDFDQQPCRNWRGFGGFVHHGAARRERWCNLPSGQHERRVPGRDHADRADRHAGGNVHQRGRGQHLPIPRCRRLISEKPKILGTAKGSLGHEAKGLAGIPTFAKGNLQGTQGNAIGDLVQNLPALGRRHVAPGWKGGFGGFGGSVDILFIASGNRADQASIHRRARLEGLSTGCRHGLPADQVRDALIPKTGEIALELFEVLIELGHGSLVLQMIADGPGFGRKLGVDVAHLKGKCDRTGGHHGG